MNLAKHLISAWLAPLFLAWPAAGATPPPLQDDLQRVVAVPVPPRHIVSLAPNLTELLFALGLEPSRIAGVTDYCNYPAAAKALPRVGGLIDWSAERVLSLHPDLVLALKSGDIRQRVLALAATGTPVFVLKIDRWPELLQALRTLGQILGKEKEAHRLSTSLQRQLPPPWPAGRAAPAVAVLVSLEPLMAAGGGTFIDEMIRLAGGGNAFAAAAGFPQLSWEGLIAAAPQLLVLALPQGQTARPSFQEKWQRLQGPRLTLAAADPDLFSRPGPRAVEAIRWLRQRMEKEAR